MAGCILVDQDKLQVINRSPAYKNQYVHRRDSVTLAAVSADEIQKRMKLGFVTASDANRGNHAADDDDEELEDSWEDFNMDDDVDDNNDNKDGNGDNEGARRASKDEEYVFDKGRRSSVDLACMSQNLHDAEAAQEVDAAAHRLYVS